jgi:N-acetylmuramoyl-L-alanine amidase
MENLPVKNYIKYNLASMLKFTSFGFLVIMASVLALNSVYAQKNPLKTIIVDPGHGGRDGGAQGSVSREALIALKIGLKVRDMLKAELPSSNILITRETDELPGGLQNKDAALRWRAEYANQNNGDLFISIHLNASAGNQRYGRRVIGTKQETYYVTQGKGKKKKKIAKTRTVNEYERFRLPPSARGTQTYILARDWYQRKVNAAQGKVKSSVADSTEMLDMFETDPVQARIMAQQYAKYFFQKSLTLATYCEEEFSQLGRYSWGVLQRDWDGIWVLQATQMPSILVETGFVDNQEEEAYLNSDKGSTEIAHGIVNAVKRYRDVLANPTKGSAAADTAVIEDKKSQEKPLVPSVLKERSIDLVETIKTSAKEITVSFYDNAEVDGDTITVYANNKAILSHQGLNTRPITFKIALTDKEPSVELVMVAESLGLVPPNTALMIVEAGGKQYKINLSSSFEKNAAVRFKYDSSAP